MTFAEQILQDRAVFFNPDELAEGALYRPQSGGEIALAVMAADLPPGELDLGSSTRQALRIWVPATEVAAPAVRDTLTLRNTPWTVTAVEIPTSDGLWPLIIERDLRLTFAR